MRKFLCAAIACLVTFGLAAQSRVNTAPAELTTKSKEVRKALYWEQKDGKWHSRKNDKLVYLGEGVHVPNFKALFIGEYAGHRYLFADEFIYRYRYPNLQETWCYYQSVLAFLLSPEDYAAMDALATGQTLRIKTRYVNEMFRGHESYSWPFFLELTETMREDGQLQNVIVLKRVNDDGKDVVRFCLYPQAAEELIDAFYFEIPYADYRLLFTPDTKTTFK